jgi:Ca2+:H+ antiporter
MAGLTKLERFLLAAVAVVVVLAGAANYGAWAAVPRFAVATLALAGLAWTVALATEQLGEHLGTAVTGMLQATLGNLPELLVVVFALKAGDLVVAQTALVGSLLASALLVLGLTIVAGSRQAPDGVMRFSSRLPNDATTLLLVTVFLIVLIGLALSSGSAAGAHVNTISVVGACCLLGVYGAWLVPYLRPKAPLGAPGAPHAPMAPLGAPGAPHAPMAPLGAPGAPHAPNAPLGAPGAPHAPMAPLGAPGAPHAPMAPLGAPGVPQAQSVQARIPLGAALALLVAAGVGSGFVSEWFVSALRPAIAVLHISTAFAGLVIVAIAGNAVEHFASITLAARGKADLAIAVVKSSVAQIAAFLFPALVLISLALPTQLTFALHPIYIGALGLMTIAVWQVTGDGEAAAFEGWALAAIYVIVAVVAAYQ